MASRMKYIIQLGRQLQETVQGGELSSESRCMREYVCYFREQSGLHCDEVQMIDQFTRYF